jgi:multisubunit Na+/H+ antiporter MnhE subunit
MLRTVLLWAATGIVLFWAWLFFEGVWAPTEIVAAACAGAIGATAALVVRRQAFNSVRFRAVHLRRIWRPLWAVVAQFAFVVPAAFRRRSGVFASSSTAGPSGSDDPVGRGERVFVAYMDTLSPNDYVIDVDRKRKLALRHVLVREKLEELP